MSKCLYQVFDIQDIKRMKYYTTELYEARVERTIDPKLWASVSSGCSKTYKADLGNSARVPSGTADQLLARYVAGMIILKQQCPMTVDNMKNSTAFRPWAQKLVQLGVDVAKVQQLWNENCGRLPKVEVGNGNANAQPINQPAAPVQNTPAQAPASEVVDDDDDFQLGDINFENGKKIPVRRTPRYIPKDRSQIFNDDDDDEEDETLVEPQPAEEPVEEPAEDDDIQYGDSFDEDDEEPAVENVPEPVNEPVDEPDDDIVEYSTDDDDLLDDTDEDDYQEDDSNYNEHDERLGLVTPNNADNEPVDEPADDNDEIEVADEPIDDESDDEEETYEEPENKIPGVAEYSTDPAQQMANIHKCLIKSRQRYFEDLHGCSDPEECMIQVTDLTKGHGIVNCENRDEAVEALNQPGGVCYKMKVFQGDPEEVKGDILWTGARVNTEYYVIVNAEEARIYYKEASGELSLTWSGDLADFGFKV